MIICIDLYFIIKIYNFSKSLLIEVIITSNMTGRDFLNF